MAKQNFKKPGQWKAYLALTWYSFRAQTRNPATFFFGFIFPIVFISIFGLIGQNPQKIEVGLTESSDPKSSIVIALKHQPFLTIDTRDENELNTKISQGKIVSIIDVSSENERQTVKLTNSTAFPQEAGAVNALIGS